MSLSRQRLAGLLLSTLSVVGFIVLWQIVVEVRGIPPIYLPAPSAIAAALSEMVLDGTLWPNLAVTLLRIFAGFFLAALAGISLGLLMGMSRIVAQIADPWLAALYPLPKISLIPLLIIWLGTGEAYNIVMSAISAFFPIVLSTYAGVQQVDRGLVLAARDLGAGPRQIQTKVILPAAIPHIFTGLHLGMGVTIILVVAAEMIGGSSQTGMGFLLINAGQVMDTDRVFASLIVMAVVGAAIVKLQHYLDRRAAPWAVVPGQRHD
jgi:ABC-type nitrate/sulfonate/bicarbonate transport system permease component